MKKGQYIFSLASAALVSAGVSVGSLHYFSDTEKTATNTTSQHHIPSQPINFSGQQNYQAAGSIDLTVAANKTVHGVVHISNFQRPNRSSSRDPFLERFFGDSHKQQNNELVLAGIGSGVIISDDGYIATNNHVIKGAEELEVVLNNNNTYKAELVGTDPTTDLALL